MSFFREGGFWWLRRAMLTIFSSCLAGFEGAAHPYKQNILRLDGEKSSIADMPEVQATMQKVAPPPASS